MLRPNGRIGPILRRPLILGAALLLVIVLGIALGIAVGGALGSARPFVGEAVEIHAWHHADSGLKARLVDRRTSSQAEVEIRIIEIEDGAPGLLDRSVPTAFWTIWRIKPDAVYGYLVRSLHFTSRSSTREGTFFMQVESLVLARTSADPREGLLVFVAFDPSEKGESEEALPEVIVAARQASLLTQGQLQILRDRQAAYDARVASLVSSWQAFADSPRSEETRAAFLASLAGVNAAPYLWPEEFFDANQRVALRGMGYHIRGRVTHDYQSGLGLRYTIVIRDCPLSQLVGDWNGERPAALTQGIQSLPRPAISVRENRRHEEANLSIPVRMSDTPEATRERILQALLGLEGMSLAGHEASGG